MDEDSGFPPSKCGMQVEGGVDRISRLPDELLLVILSFLRVREAAATTILSSRWFDLWKQAPNLKFDRVSQLPDEILLVILSSLSLKEVVATSILSSRWSHLWKYTPHLNFDRTVYKPSREVHRITTVRDLDRFWDVERFSRIVNAVIQSHKALSLKSLSFFFRLSNSDKCAVAKWLEPLFSRRVESLQLYFESTVADGLVLEELLRESRICLKPQTDSICLFQQSLKRLCLGCLKVSGEDIKLFLHNCPLLEELEIELAILTSDVEICGAKLMLKHLDIYYCEGERSIKIFAPKLTYIRFSDESGKLLLENVPELVEASFCLARSDGVLRLFASPESCSFSQLQLLFLKFLGNKTFCQLLVILANEFSQMPNLKKLVIYCTQPYNHGLLSVTALIWAYPRLEEFTLEFSGLGEFEPAYMQVMRHDGRSPHQHLKLFRLLISRRQSVGDDMAELVTYISDNCVALRKIVVGHGDYDQRDAMANKEYLTERLQGKIPNHVQLELFNPYDVMYYPF